jgi:hypothetical protein
MRERVLSEIRRTDNLEKYTLILLTAGLLRSFSFRLTFERLFLALAFAWSTPPHKTSKFNAKKMNINLFTMFSSLSLYKTNQQNKLEWLQTLGDIYKVSLVYRRKKIEFLKPFLKYPWLISLEKKKKKYHSLPIKSTFGKITTHLIN